ncbi:MAG: hypothetical protein PUC59_08540 [Firmicutes bacterium]|nr:hypothetical protein [Bacillota bacterium]
MDPNQRAAVIYRCPSCLNSLVDVTIAKGEDGIYRCMKCSYTGTEEQLQKDYQNFRSRYRLLHKRLTLEDQRRL